MFFPLVFCLRLCLLFFHEKVLPSFTNSDSAFEPSGLNAFSGDPAKGQKLTRLSFLRLLDNPWDSVWISNFLGSSRIPTEKVGKKKPVEDPKR